MAHTNQTMINSNFSIRFDNAINYIEENLCSKIDYNKLSKIMLCSEDNFARMFSMFTGVTLTEYIRRRKITLAGIDLLNHKLSVLEASIKYGYGSQTAFTRAFKYYHSITPGRSIEEMVS